MTHKNTRQSVTRLSLVLPSSNVTLIFSSLNYDRRPRDFVRVFPANNQTILQAFLIATQHQVHAHRPLSPVTMSMVNKKCTMSISSVTL